MAVEQIAASGVRAQMRAVENAAHNVSQLHVSDPILVRTRFESEAPPPRGAGGVRAETELVPSRTSAGPVLSPEIEDSLVTEGVDLVQQLTDTLVARRAFQANLSVERASRAFIESTLNIGA
jgi:hypothetical protein